MKKLFFVLVCIFLSINVSSVDIFGQWNVTFEIVKDDEIVTKKIEVEFLADTCIFYREDGKDLYQYYVDECDETFLFISNSGYILKEINDNIFKLTPAFESEVKEIYFRK